LPAQEYDCTEQIQEQFISREHAYAS
jgi:hypothetical protein